MASFFVVHNKTTDARIVDVILNAFKSINHSYTSIFVDKRIGIAGESYEYGIYDSPTKDSTLSDLFSADEESSCCIVADSRIDYKKELIEKLGIEWKVAKSFSNSRLVLFAYLKWGEACLEHLFGDFSFVIWDAKRDEILCAKDHFGTRPLYYIDHRDYLIIASRLADLNNLPDVKFEINEQYILDSICSIEINSEESAYNGICRIKPAHFLKYSNLEAAKQCCYWDLRVNKDYSGLSLEEAICGLRDRIFESVKQRCQSNRTLGVELSGGLDSSGIASVMVELLGPNVPINAFTHSISSQCAAQHSYLKSEIEFSKTVVEEFNSICHYVVTEENAEGSFTAIINALNQFVKPVNQGFSMNSDLLFQAANKSGISVILSGLGGDEGITNNGIGYFNELIKQGQHSVLRDIISNIGSGNQVYIIKRLIKKYINYYTPWIFSIYIRDWRKDKFRSFALQKDLARKYKMKKRFFHMMSSPRNPDILTNQYFKITHPNIPERLEETYLLAQKQGIEYRYPFLDVKLLEFFYSLPSNYKYKDGCGRYLFRLAMVGILPEKIRLRKDKVGTTIPNVLVRILKDEKIFLEIIRDGKQNNTFHYAAYDKLIDMLDTFGRANEIDRMKYSPRAFLNPVSVLILQKWQREGKIDIGIKC